jgi:hypothetical protein
MANFGLGQADLGSEQCLRVTNDVRDEYSYAGSFGHGSSR